MFTAPPPPTGPQTELPLATDNRLAAYRLWRATEGGQEAYGLIVKRALDLAASGAKRISVNELVESVRMALKVKVNNTWRALIADDLVLHYPRLLELIERRKRKGA